MVESSGRTSPSSSSERTGLPVAIRRSGRSRPASRPRVMVSSGSLAVVRQVETQRPTLQAKGTLSQ